MNQKVLGETYSDHKSPLSVIEGK